MSTKNSSKTKAPAASAATAARRASNRDILAGIMEPVKNKQQAIAVNREMMMKLLADYRQDLEIKTQASLQPGEVLRYRSVEEFILSRITRATPGVEAEALKNKSAAELVPLLKRFDWRALQIVPEVAQQANNTCWAETASAAFEASLRRQRANFSTMKQGENSFKVEVLNLEVKSTLDRVPPFYDQEASGGRHENAFNFYFNEGIPLNEISLLDDLAAVGVIIRDPSKPDLPPPPPPPKEKPKFVKAIAWNYVGDVNVDDLAEPPSVEAMKRALLEHGPLAVMVARDEAFKNYGRATEVQFAPPRMSLRFRSGVRKEVAPESYVLLTVSLSALSLKDSTLPEADQLFEKDLVLSFAPEFKPVIETSSTKMIPARAVGADLTVQPKRWEGNLSVFIFSENGVVCEVDAATNDVLLHFPANTNAELLELEGGGVQLRFPKDPAPVFAETTADSVNHYVLLIGWDDTKGPHGAWIIQNHQGTTWGCQCDGPTVRGWDPMPGADNRGYMYIGYGCNKIGTFAAWIEARCLSEKWIMTLKPIAMPPLSGN